MKKFTDEQMAEKVTLRLKGLSQLKTNTNAYKAAMEAINNPGKKVYTFYYTRSGKWSHTVNVTREVTEYLKALCYQIVSGNDAQRGGKSGQFIIVVKQP